MVEYEEFRVQLTPSIAQTGRWDVQLDSCPISNLAGPKGSIVPSFERNKLLRLRNRNGWPDHNELKEIGEAVWKNLMTANLEAAFEACLALCNEKNKGLRVLISIVGGDDEQVQNGIVSMAELPIEALFKAQHGFVAMRDTIPVSRSLQAKPDRSPVRITLPIRVLVVASTPTDKPRSNAQDELQAIRNALGGLIVPGGPVELEICDPPTKDELGKRVNQGAQILHFIGHGGFDIVGDDPTPRAHLCLQRPQGGSRPGETDPIDADTLSLMLQGNACDVSLVVLSACSSAAPTPNQDPYDHAAFSGVAQRLVSGTSGVSAVVAMQFDMETNAAVEFSKALYESFFQLGQKRLDEAVTRARIQLATALDPGHRAWVTPSVYWRCKDGEVFEILSLLSDLDNATRFEIRELDAILRTYRKNLDDLARSLADKPDLADLKDQWLHEVGRLTARRSELLGETIRLHGGNAAPGAQISCPLSLRQRLAGRIERVKVRITFPAEKLIFEDCLPGADAQNANPMIGGAHQTGEIIVSIDHPSQQQQWQAGEYEICRLNFRVADDSPVGFLSIKTTVEHVDRNGQQDAFNPMDADLFVD